MNVWMLDYDGRIPNLALMRLSAWHKNQGDTVILKKGHIEPDLFGIPDKMYVSSIFRWNRDKVLDLSDWWSQWTDTSIGGTGIDTCTTLPENIQNVDPDYSLYCSPDALGFISRGCPNKCPWCVVPQKEGGIHRVSTAQEICQDRKKATFLDNNFLALPDYESDLIWLAENKIKVDFNQGLDARRVDQKAATLLSKCKFDYVRFALDTPRQKRSLSNAVSLLRENGLKRPIAVYVLIGFDSFESDIDRLFFCHEIGCVPRPMKYRDLETGEKPLNDWPGDTYAKWPRQAWRYYYRDDMWEAFRNAIRQKV